MTSTKGTSQSWREPAVGHAALEVGAASSHTCSVDVFMMIRVETQDSVKSKDPTRSCALRKRDSRVSIGSAQALSAAHVMQQREAGFRRDGTARVLHFGLKFGSCEPGLIS